MKLIITIGARGGSKGLKNKNIRHLCEEPLIAYTIKQSLAWAKAAHVIVSTDSPEIAETAKRYGADVPFIRPEELARDTAKKLPVIRHAWREAERIYNDRYDFVIDLDVTAPLRRISDIENALNLATEKKSKTLFSVVPADKNPYFNMVEIDASGVASLSKTINGPISRRQDAPRVYNMNASIYVFSRDFLEDESYASIFTDRTHVYVMDEISKVDIDTELDFMFVEFLMRGKIWESELE